MKTRFCAVLLVVGCNTMDLPSLEPPAQTNYPSGIYAGELTTRTTMALFGQVIFDETNTKPFNETVDVNGLPLIQPQGVTPQTGVVVEDDDGELFTRFVVVSVQVAGNRLTINYETRAEDRTSGVVLEGDGMWFYDFAPPNTLNFRGTVIGLRFNPDGSTWTWTATSEGTFVQ